MDDTTLREECFLHYLSVLIRSFEKIILFTSNFLLITNVACYKLKDLAKVVFFFRIRKKKKRKRKRKKKEQRNSDGVLQ